VISPGPFACDPLEFLPNEVKKETGTRVRVGVRGAEAAELTTTVEMQSGSRVVSLSSHGQRARKAMASRKKAAALWSRIQRVAVAMEVASSWALVHWAAVRSRKA
jgi:hypothetical protein